MLAKETKNVGKGDKKCWGRRQMWGYTQNMLVKETKMLRKETKNVGIKNTKYWGKKHKCSGNYTNVFGWDNDKNVGERDKKCWGRRQMLGKETNVRI